MSHKLIKLKLIEETEKYYLFNVELEVTSFWGKKSSVKFEAGRRKDFIQSFRISDGKSLFHDYMGLDASINLILDRDFKNYLINTY